MKFFIDCEWNDYKGELLSIALVEINTDAAWYVELQYEAKLSEWVADNVYPHLTKHPYSLRAAQQSLLHFLTAYENEEHIEIIADWPEDIARFCDFLITGPGTCIQVDISKFRFTITPCRGPHSSCLPHNALHDAIANKLNYLYTHQR